MRITEFRQVRHLLLIFSLTVSGLSIDQAAADPDPFIPHWVGLIPADFLDKNQFNDDLENQSWEISLHEKPSNESTKIGTIHVEFGPDQPLKANYLATNNTVSIGVEPHLYETDWGYSDFFHLTALELFDGGWVKVKPHLAVQASWGNFEVVFGKRNINFHDIRRGSILSWINNEGGNEFVFVEHTNPESIVVRPEQSIDMWCGDDELRYSAYETKLIPKTDWINHDSGVSRFNEIYTRGC